MKRTLLPLPISPDFPVIIIGSGPVGDRLARELLRRAPETPLVAFEEEPWDPYDRINLVGVLTGEMSWADLENTVPIPEETQLIRHHDSVVAIDRDARTVTDRRGRQHAYSILAFVTGAHASVPNIPGMDLKNILTFRHKCDVDALMSRRKESRRIAVMGGGVLGLEIACGLGKAGTEVCIVQNERLLGRQMDAKGSAMVLAHVRALGIQVVLDRAQEILGAEAVTGIRMYSGQVVECDTIVAATGVQPTVDLALKAGIRVGRGIKINDLMQTSDPLIYAVGDCAEHRGRVYGLVGAGFEQAAVAAQNILGGKARYQGSVAVTRLKGVDLPAVNVSRLEVDPPVYEELAYEQPDAQGYRKLLLHKGRVMGAVAIGEWPGVWRVEEAARRGRRLWPWQRRRFRATGSPWPERRVLTVAEWPAQATVCNCKGITRGILSRAMQAGHGTVEALQERTGAGTGCGACKPLLTQLVGAEGTTPSATGEKSFIGACCAAFMLILVIGGLPHFAPADSVQGYWHPEILWQDRFWKQVSGYSLVALSFLALTLSLRKRWKRFSFAGFGSWRLLHGVVGVLALVLLVIHTGLNLGRSPLDFALMTTFLGLSLFGAIAGGITVAEGRSVSPTLRDWYARWIWYHTLLLWPLPVLIAFHILAAYYF